MARGSTAKTAFNAGEFSPLMDGRADFGKYPAACVLLQNYLPMVSGPARRRPGTRFIASEGTAQVVLVPFVFNREQSYVLAIGVDGGGIHVYSDRGIIESSPGTPYMFGDAVWPTPPRRSDGSVRISWAQSGDQLFVCDSEGNLPLQVISRISDTSWTVEAAEFAPPPIKDIQLDDEPMQIWKPIADPDLGFEEYWAYVETPDRVSINTTFEPTGIDEIFCVEDSGHPLVFREFTVGMNMSRGQFLIANGAYYQLVSASAALLTINEPPSHFYGVKTYATDVAWLYVGSGRWYFQVVESGVAGNPDVPVGAKVAKVRRIPGDAAEISYGYDYGATTSMFALSTGIGGFVSHRWAWNEIAQTESPTFGGLPERVQFFRNRMILTKGNRIYGSVAGDFLNFAYSDASGNLAADSAFLLEISTGDVTDISWIVSADVLLVGTFSGEFVLAEQNGDEAFGPLNVKIDHYGASGASKALPVRIDDDVVYISRTGKRVRRFTWDSSRDGYKSIDMSILAEHLGFNPFRDIVSQKEPANVLWLTTSSGELRGITYDRDQDVTAWHRHDVGGPVSAVCVIPSPDGTVDDLWLLVERGGTYYVECLIDEYQLGVDVEDQVYLDSHLTYSGAATDTISGLDHLDGLTVQILADGATHADKSVSGGSVTLDRDASVVHVGLHNVSRLKTTRLDIQSDDGPGIGKTRRIHNIVVRLLETVGFKIGPSFTNMQREEFRVPGDSMDQGVPAYTGDKVVRFPGPYDTDGYICIEQDQPLPCTIVALGIEFEVNSR